MQNLKDLESRLIKGEIDRRTFIGGALALGMTVSAATILASKA